MNEQHPFSDFMNITVTKAESESAEAYMLITKELTDHLGHVTGAAYCALADAAGGACARASGDMYVTQNCSMQYYQSTVPEEDEKLYARAVLRHRGSRTCIVAVELFHKDGSIVSDGQFSYSRI